MNNEAGYCWILARNFKDYYLLSGSGDCEGAHGLSDGRLLSCEHGCISFVLYTFLMLLKVQLATAVKC